MESWQRNYHGLSAIIKEITHYIWLCYTANQGQNKELIVQIK